MHSPRTNESMGHLYWVVGPVGAGKSTLAHELAREYRAVRMNVDEWMVALFRADGPETGILERYRERAEDCRARIWSLTERLARAGTHVVLELGMFERCDRAPFFRSLDASGHPVTIYVVDAPRKERRERVKRRNLERGATFSVIVPPELFELASDAWEPLDASECAGRDVRFMTSG